jgi:hypothetical protein
VIAFANAQNATAEGLGPVVDQIQTILASANNEIQQLSGQPTSVILASPDGHGQIDSKGLGALITQLLYKLIAALRLLLQHLGPKIQNLLYQLVGDLMYVTSSVLQSTVLTGYFCLIVRRLMTCCTMSTASSTAFKSISFPPSTG